MPSPLLAVFNSFGGCSNNLDFSTKKWYSETCTEIRILIDNPGVVNKAKLMKNRNLSNNIAFFPLLFVFFIGLFTFPVYAGTDLRLSSGMKITRVSKPPAPDIFAAAAADMDYPAAALFPQPPLAGFSPLVAITASNKRLWDDFDFEHRLEAGYSGTPLIGSASQNYIIGIFDSGAVVDLIAGASADTLGVVGGYLTINSIPIGGVGGSVDALVSQPIALFAAGLGAVDPNGTLDVTQVKGHSNASIVVAPEISCSNNEEVTGVIGTPFLSFYTTVIRNDQNRTLQRDGKVYSSPDVQLLSSSSPSIPSYPHKIAMEISSLGLVTTAAYYPDFFDLETPMIPTMLGTPLSIPWGGAFFTTIYVVEGEPGPTNPLQPMRVMVDTGAQSSIITPAMAAMLSLPVTPDYAVDVCGVGGLTTDIPVYLIDYVKINALGGAMEFSNAPFVMLDLGSPDGLPLDGVLGMNFFWNRNIVFQPSIAGSSFFQVSDPVAYGNPDLNFDRRMDLADFAIFAAAWMSQAPDESYNPLCDLYLDSRVDEKDFEAFLAHWLAGTAP